MMMIYVLTMPWFLFLGFGYMIKFFLDEDYPGHEFVLVCALAWPITAAILAGVQLAEFFNKGKR